MTRIPRRLVAALLAFAVFVPPAFSPALAQQQPSANSTARPRINGFDVTAVAQTAPGNELMFTLYGSPGGIAGVSIGGATSGLLLDEVEAGVYEGRYTIGRRDRITAESTATANLRIGNYVATSVLDESLVTRKRARGDRSAAATAPRIERFDVDAPSRLVPGAELVFTLAGTPGGAASVRIAGVRGKLALEEQRSGVYEGTYRIRNRDQIAAGTVVTGNLRLGEQERTQVLGQSLVDSAPSRNSNSSGRRAAVAPVATCLNCGVVESINVVEAQGNGSYLGMIAGGVAGALLGSQVGSGSGTTVATMAGAAGGAFAGNEIEKRMKASKHYEVVVRLENGGTQTVSYPAAPALNVGSRVRVEGGTLIAL